MGQNIGLMCMMVQNIIFVFNLLINVHSFCFFCFRQQIQMRSNSADLPLIYIYCTFLKCPYASAVMRLIQKVSTVLL